MKIAILIASRNRPDRIETLAAHLGQNVQVDADWISIEAGTDPDKLTPLTTIHYEDAEFSGFCMAHAVGVERARELARGGTPFDYYWVLTPELEFDQGIDPVAPLIEAMEHDPRLAVLAHTRRADDASLAGEGRQQPGGGWRAGIPTEATGFLMRAQAAEQCGFLNPAFRYGDGAMAELAYTLLQAGWTLGFSDDVAYRQVGETTYGAQSHPITSEERERRARRFAYTYFLRICGPGWAEVFGETARAAELPLDAFAELRRHWAGAFAPDELSDLHASCASAKPLPVPENEPPSALLHDDSPWPLATEAAHRLLAWPRYDQPDDIEAVLGIWADALIDEPERCLCLRLDPERDVGLAEATRLVQEIYDRLVGDEHTLDVLFVDEAMGADDLERLGRAVDGVLEIPGCDDPARQAFAQSVGAPRLGSLHELLLARPSRA